MSELIERDDELRALAAAADAVAGGGARCVAITGEAGVGKSRLAREFAGGLGWTVQLASGAWPHLRDERPLLLVVDDAERLDPAALTVAALDGLEHVLVVLAFRLPAAAPERRALAALARDPRVDELRLVPLSPAGLDRMAAALGRYAPDDLYERTGGNPFWAEEILGAGERLPWTLVEAVASRLDPLPPAARDLAVALAVAGEPLPPRPAVRIFTMPVLDRAWAALTEAGLVHDGGLRHALLGEAIQATLGPGELGAWHARVAAALEPEAGVERDRVARHWAAAGEPARAAALARPAAYELQAQGATRRAFECFRIAVAGAPEDAGLLADAARAAARLGEYDAMRGWLSAAQRLYPPDRAARLLLDPAFDYLPVRRSAAAREEPVERLLSAALASGEREPLEQAVAAARERADPMALARAARLVAGGLGEFERAAALLGEALALPGVGPGHESRIRTIRANLRFAQGYPLEAIDELRAGLAISRLAADDVVRTGQIALADALLKAGRIDEGADTFLDALAGLPAPGPMVDVIEGIRRFERGDVDGGLAQLSSGSDRLLETLDLDPIGLAVVATHTLSGRAVAEVHAGRPDAAVATVRRVDALARAPYGEAAADFAYVLARAGEHEEAARRIGDLARVASGPGVLGVQAAVRAFAAPAEHRFAAAAELLERAPRAVLAAELWCDAGGAGSERARRLCERHGLTRIARRLGGLPARLTGLTRREREVVVLAAEGLSNRAIGARLHLAEGTVRNYLSAACGKLGVTRRAELGRRVPSA